MPLDIDGAGRSRSLACLPTGRGTVAPTSRKSAFRGLKGAFRGLQGPPQAFRALQERPPPSASRTSSSRPFSKTFKVFSARRLHQRLARASRGLQEPSTPSKRLRSPPGANNRRGPQLQGPRGSSPPTTSKPLTQQQPEGC